MKPGCVVSPPRQDLLPYKKQGPGFLSRLGETVRAMASSVRGLKSRPEEFSLMQEYVEDFSIKISSVDKVTQRIIKEQRGAPPHALAPSLQTGPLAAWNNNRPVVVGDRWIHPAGLHLNVSSVSCQSTWMS